jgi:hypothetical protein
MGLLDYFRGFKKSNRYRTISKQRLPEWNMYGKRIDRRPNIIKFNPAGVKVGTMTSKESLMWDKKFRDFRDKLKGK